MLISILAGLGEFRLRDLNDEINKLLREKGHWEDRIMELGGPDYRVCHLKYNFKGHSSFLLEKIEGFVPDPT